MSSPCNAADAEPALDGNTAIAAWIPKCSQALILRNLHTLFRGMCAYGLFWRLGSLGQQNRGEVGGEGQRAAIDSDAAR